LKLNDLKNEFKEITPMKVSLLTQIAPENRLLTRLGPQAKDAESAIVAVSFIQRSGMKHLFQRLRPLLDRDRPVTIFTSGYLGITDPLALEDLLRLTKLYKSLKAFFNLEERFHSKFLLFDKPRSSYALFLGSSNISVEGLAATGELNVHVRGQKSDSIYRDMQIVIGSLRQSHRFEELAQDLIAEYRRHYPKRSTKQGLPARRVRLILPSDKMPVYLIWQRFTVAEERKIKKKHPRWDNYVSYDRLLKKLKLGDHFICIRKLRGERPTFTMCKYLEHDRIGGVGTVAHIKDGAILSLKKLSDRLRITEKELLRTKHLDVYGIAITRRDFKDAFG
jgi:HKD family nuclease